jgi:hypothetical protein
MVPASFAEKAMASLMQLHSELMDEKERRVDLHRRLMEKEQSLAELRMYVKLLEEKAAAKPAVQARPPAVRPVPRPDTPTQVREAVPPLRSVQAPVSPAAKATQVAELRSVPSPKPPEKVSEPSKPASEPPRKAAAGATRPTFGWRSW